ncbi:MAG: ATP-dependent DNA ligase, partial [Lapillicoccus sp.]
GTVSTPVEWSEVDDVSPLDFTMGTVPERYAAKGDLMAGMDDPDHPAYRLDELLEWAERDERDGASVPDLADEGDEGGA